MHNKVWEPLTYQVSHSQDPFDLITANSSYEFLVYLAMVNPK